MWNLFLKYESLDCLQFSVKIEHLRSENPDMGRRETNIPKFHKLITLNKMLENYFHRLLYDEIEFFSATRVSRNGIPKLLSTKSPTKKRTFKSL